MKKVILIFLMSLGLEAQAQNSNPNPYDGAGNYAMAVKGDCRVDWAPECFAWPTWDSGPNRKWIEVDCPPCLEECFKGGRRIPCKCYRLIGIIPQFPTIAVRPLPAFLRSRRGA